MWSWSGDKTVVIIAVAVSPQMTSPLVKERLIKAANGEGEKAAHWG